MPSGALLCSIRQQLRRKYFEWENAKDLSKYGSMDSVQVTAALKGSNYLQKWVD